MTETNINALCSVEAVFDGVDIDVTVEFSAGGGTFEHDELTAESRAKADQHPIGAITDLQRQLTVLESEQLAQWEAIQASEGAANAAGNLAAQSSQAAQQAEGIAESAATTAGEAAQAINEHAQATNNPHATNVTQEFADTQITPLATEATYTPTVWSYLVGLFTTVPKSVKEHIVKGWTVLQDLSSRVKTLENDIRDFSVTVTQDVASVELTNLNIPKGSVIHLTVDWVYTAGVPASLYRLEFNDVVSGYMSTGISATAYINLYAPLSEDGQTQAVIYFADTITAMTMNIRKATGTSPTILNLMGSRPDFPDSAINTIRIRTAESGKVIAAGSKVNVKVIK